MNGTIHADLSIRAVADTSRMPWTPSPSPSVWRKRVFLVGPPESGQVTSIVRYDAGSTFHAHDHPDGEEILALDGVFSDEAGDWPAGTYLLNPEGFRHAPFSVPGCLLFVKLRQYPGRSRQHVAISTQKLAWQPGLVSGVTEKVLYRQAGFEDTTRLERWDPQTDCGIVAYDQGVELLVLEGEFSDAAGTYQKGCWLRLPAGSRHHPQTRGGCTVYKKTAGEAL